MQEKTDLQKRMERAESQLAWLCGLVRGVRDRPETPAAIRETLTKALDVVGADKWLTAISDPTNSKS